MISLMKPVRADVMAAEYTFRLIEATTDEEIERIANKIRRVRRAIQTEDNTSAFSQALCCILLYHPIPDVKSLHCLSEEECAKWASACERAEKLKRSK